MPSAEIIAIGTELLLGEINDTNTAFIAKELNKIGIDIFRTIIVGDNNSRITEQIKQSLGRAEIVITTGGLGPTIDDPTRQAVADVFGKKLIFQDHLWEQIQSRFNSFHSTATDNNKKQAFLPENATLIENPVGTAPAFYVSDNNRIIVSLPGVPSEMEFLIKNKIISLLSSVFELHSTTLSRIIHTAGIGESSVDNLIGELETLKNPTVGITAKAGQVDIRITAKGNNKKEVKALIKPIEENIMKKMGEFVFGFDQDTLEEALYHQLHAKKLGIHLFCYVQNNDFINKMYDSEIFSEILSTSGEKSNEDVDSRSLYNKSNKRILLVYLNEIPDSRSGFSWRIMYQNNIHTGELWFGGHKDLIAEWMKNHLLYSIYKVLRDKGEK